MSSALLVPPPIAIPSEAEAESEFRRSVLANEFSQEVCDSAYRTADEWHAARRQYDSRLDGRRTLDEIVPTLKAKAAELEKATASAFDLGDHVTLLQLREMVAEINPSLPTSTPQELSRALMVISDEPLRRQAASMNAAMRANDVEREAVCLLNRTAAAVPAGESSQLRTQIQELENRIAGRRWALIAEENIPAARQRLSAARGLPENVGQSEWTYRRDEIRSAQQNLSELMRLAKTRTQADRDNSADQAEIGRLRIALQAAELREREWPLVPEHMAFD